MADDIKSGLDGYVESLKSLRAELRANAAQVQKLQETWQTLKRSAVDPIINAFKLDSIIRGIDQLAKTSTEYLRVASALKNEITEVTDSLQDLKDASAYYSDIAGAKIVSTLLAQSQGMRQNLELTTRVARDLKTLYLTTDDATKAASNYTEVVARMPGFLEEITNSAIDTNRALNMLLAAEPMGMGLDNMLIAVNDQLALMKRQDLTGFAGASRELINSWENFKEHLTDVTIILARALGNKEFAQSIANALETIANLAVRAAGALAEWINGLDWDAITDKLDSAVGVIKNLAEVALKYGKTLLWIYGIYRLLKAVPLGKVIEYAVFNRAIQGAVTKAAMQTAGSALGGAVTEGAAGAAGAAAGGTSSLVSIVSSVISAAPVVAAIASVIAALGITYKLSGAGKALSQEYQAARDAGMEAGGWLSRRWEGIKGALGFRTRAREYIEQWAEKPVTKEEIQRRLERMRAEHGGTPRELAAQKVLEDRERGIAEQRQEALERLISQGRIFMQQIQQAQAMLQVLQNQRTILEINYEISKDMALNAEGMRESAHQQVANLESQIRQNQFLLNLSQRRIKVLGELLATDNDEVRQAGYRAAIAQEGIKMSALQAQIERDRLEQSKAILRNISDELDMRNKILDVIMAQINARMNYNRALSYGVHIANQERAIFLEQQQMQINLQRQYIRDARARLMTEVDPRRREAMRLELMKAEAEVMEREARLIEERRTQTREIFESVRKYTQAYTDMYAAQYEYQGRINAGLSFSTEQRMQNIKLQERMLAISIDTARRQAQFALNQAKITGDWGQYLIAYETYTTLLRESASLIDKEVNAIREYYSRLTEFLGARVGLAQSELELMEKANLGLGVNITQRMRVFALEKQALDMREAELNNRLRIINTMVDERAKRQAMIEYEKDLTDLTRDRANLIDKMKISMEDYLDAFTAASAGVADAFSKVLDPLQNADRLMQQFSGGVMSLARGATFGNVMREYASALQGNERSMLQLGGFARQWQLAGGRGYVPRETLSVGAALGAIAAGGGGLYGGQYWGQHLAGPGLTPGGPGVQGIGAVASVLFPHGVLPGMQLYRNIGTPTQYGYRAIRRAMSANAGLQAANPIQFGAGLIQGAVGPQGRYRTGAAGPSGTTLVFNIQGNRADIERRVISAIREMLDPSGHPVSNRR